MYVSKNEFSLAMIIKGIFILILPCLTYKFSFYRNVAVVLTRDNGFPVCTLGLKMQYLSDGSFNRLMTIHGLPSIVSGGSKKAFYTEAQMNYTTQYLDFLLSPVFMNTYINKCIRKRIQTDLEGNGSLNVC